MSFRVLAVGALRMPSQWQSVEWYAQVSYWTEIFLKMYIVHIHRSENILTKFKNNNNKNPHRSDINVWRWWTECGVDECDRMQAWKMWQQPTALHAIHTFIYIQPNSFIFQFRSLSSIIVCLCALRTFVCRNSSFRLLCWRRRCFLLLPL